MYTDSIHFAVLGSDKRQEYLSRLLQEDGYSVTNVSDAEIVLLPIPLIPVEEVLENIPHCRMLFAGCIPKEFERKANARGIDCLDYMQDETFIYQNTIATAEGAIAEAILHSPENLTLASCLVIGYGHCGQTLVSLLEQFHCHITVCDKEKEARARACVHADVCISPSGLAAVLPNVSYIFNTAPALVLDKKLLPSVRRDACILDLASAPGGVDYEAASALECKASLLPGLPGKYAPKASAKIMLAFILHHIK